MKYIYFYKEELNEKKTKWVDRLFTKFTFTLYHLIQIRVTSLQFKLSNMNMDNAHAERDIWGRAEADFP